MSLFDKNMAALEISYPKVYEKINELLADGYECTGVSTEAAKNGEPVLIYEKDGKSYRLNSRYNPKAEAKKWLEQFKFDNLAMVIQLFGIGNATFLRELVDTINTETGIIAYEPSLDIFMHVIANYDITDIIENKRIQLIIDGLNETYFIVALSGNVEWLNLYCQVYCKHPHFEQLFEEQHETYMHIIRDNNDQAVMNRNTILKLGPLSIENELVLLKDLMKTNNVCDFIGKIPEDIPAIIVSAGPSLDKNYELLREAKGKSIIICVDRALNKLLSNGIIPDFTITLDARALLSNYKNDRSNDIPLMIDISGNPTIYEMNRSRKFLYNNDGFLKAIYKQLGKDYYNLTAGGCVATAAFSACVTMEMKTIIFIGQDLAFEGNKTHTDSEESEEFNAASLIEVDGVNGGKVMTRYDMYSYLQWFESAITNMGGAVRCIDATEGGALIRGTEVMTFREAIDECCQKEFDCTQLIHDMPYSFEGMDIENFKEYMQFCSKQLKEFKTKAGEGAKKAKTLIHQGMDHRGPNQKGVKLIKDIGKIYETLEENVLYEMLDIYAAKDSLEELNDVYIMRGQEDSEKEVYEKTIKVYEAFVKACDTLEPKFKTLCDALN
ncbi:motility accessory factor [Lachnospiraceae bacterium KM106-2]|nr:motility accessory factor [Lachnospiraceae bacterium KM106-2]